MRTTKPTNNALTVLFNKTCVLLLSLLYNNAGKMFYLREIARRTGVGAGTAQRELSKLTAAGLVVRRVDGKQVYYGANADSHVFNEIRGLVLKTFGLANVINDALRPLSAKIELAFIYGSQADGTSTSDSDVDLMIVGRVSDVELHKAVSRAENNLNKTVNYSLITPVEFKKRKKEKKGFIERIVTGKRIMLIGNENEI